MDEVYVHNQYQLPDKMSGTVFDIGAHVGSFARAALDRGADLVVCFEPCPRNFEMLSINTMGYGSRVVLRNLPVWRSDVPESVGFSDCGKYTACGTVISSGTGRATMGLDQIIDWYGRPSLVKIDAEGSEYPILYTCSMLDAIEAIVGEAHPTASGADLSALAGKKVGGAPVEDFAPERLFTFLEGHGFDVRSWPENDQANHNTLFWAKKNANQQDTD